MSTGSPEAVQKFVNGSAAVPSADLVNVFRAMRQDARSEPKASDMARTFVINIGFDGAGGLPVVGQCQVLPLGLIKARIVNALVVANGVGSATIDVRLGTLSDMPNLAPIYGTGITNIPTLPGLTAVLLDTSTWTLNLQPSDVIIATLMTVSSVTPSPSPLALTSVTLSLFCRHLKWPAGSNRAVDSSGNRVVDSNGNAVTNRS